MLIFFFFFFQAEDGIRDWSVTGVQTCALPISFHLPVTQNQIGSATGLSTVHVNRSLQELKKGGLALLGGAEARVLDWKGLQDAAGFDPAYLYIGPSPHQ